MPAILTLDARDCLVTDRARSGTPSKGSHTSGDVVQRGKVFQIPAIAAQHDLAQVYQAVDGLLDRGEAPRWWSVPVFHLAVVLEERHVIGRGGTEPRSEPADGSDPARHP
jgi:hypothetical protein